MTYTYQTEFPDFDPATLPAIPADWIDHSYRNDVCPCWSTSNGLMVWIDYADDAMREFPGGKRFHVTDRPSLDGDIEDLHYGDDWNALLAFVASYKPSFGRGIGAAVEPLP